jgi:hypothetical protein
VQSDHFKKAQQTLPPHLAETPRIVNVTVPQNDWSALGELAVPEGRVTAEGQPRGRARSAAPSMASRARAAGLAGGSATMATATSKAGAGGRSGR